MRILYFASVDFYAKPNPSFHLMHSMISDLLNAGHEVYYVGCELEGIEKHIPEEFQINPRFAFSLVRQPSTAKSNFVKRYLDGIKYAIDAKKHIIKFSSQCDVVYVQSSPTVLYNLIVVKKFVSKKVVYNVQDMFPGSSIASGVMPQKWMQKIFFRLQKVAYNKADVIVAISEDMKIKLIEQGVEPSKIEVIVNWFDDSSIREIDWAENRFVQKYQLSKDKFYVQYAGTMGYVFDYEMVLAVAEILKPYKNIEIMMIGEGSQKEAFVNKAKEKKLDNIVFLPLEPQNMVSDVYSACSVCFIPLKKGIIGNSVPSKAGLLMACKRPIVTTADEGSGYNHMINDNVLGYAMGTDAPEKAAEALLTLSRQPQLCYRMGQNGYAYGKELYSRRNNMKRYIELFCKTAGR